MARVRWGSFAGAAVGHGRARAEPSAIAPARMVVTRKHPGIAPGEILCTAGGSPVIADAGGAPLWSSSTGQPTCSNLQMQQYRGVNVLTWWQGRGGPASGGIGTGTGVLTTLDHRPVATIGPPGDHHPDTHELRLTPEGTALITSYRTVPHDPSPVGGPSDAGSCATPTARRSTSPPAESCTGRARSTTCP